MMQVYNLIKQFSIIFNNNKMFKINHLFMFYIICFYAVKQIAMMKMVKMYIKLSNDVLRIYNNELYFWKTETYRNSGKDFRTS